MIKRLLLITLLALASLSLAFRQSSQPRWEYKVEQRGTMGEKKLNELGAQGWELVGTPTTTHTGTTMELHYVFKRAAR